MTKVASVRLGSLHISGDRVTDGFELDEDGIDGWHGGGYDVRRDDTPVPQGHGSFDVPVFLTSRVVTVTGRCVASSQERLAWHRGRLMGTLAQGNSGRIIVEDLGETLWADVRLAAGTKWTQFGGQPYATFKLSLWSKSPQKYGEGRTFGSGEAAFHYGNFPAVPVITVAGTMPNGYTINGPAGKKYVVTAGVTPTDSHIIDMATGILRIDGVPVYGKVSQGDTWAIPPGQAVAMTLAPVSGAGTISAVVVDTHV